MLSLILGGNGFIGSHLADALIAKGDTVRIFDRGPDSFRKPLSGVEYYTAEFSDTGLLAEALTSVDIVYHLISTTVPSTSNLDPVNDITSNLVSTVKLLELMKLQNVPKIVYLSSGGTVYGIPKSSPISETHTLNPISSYGAVKVAIENYLHIFHHLHGIKYVALRASNPYGSRQGHTGVQGVIGTFLQKIAEGKSIEIWGDGSVVRDYIYIDDLINLCVISGNADVNGIFNAGSGDGHSILDVVVAIEDVIKLPVQLVYMPGRAFDVPHTNLDISKAQELFGWQPSVSLIDGIRLAWGWVQTSKH